jgi:hypothetical protein
MAAPTPAPARNLKSNISKFTSAFFKTENITDIWDNIIVPNIQEEFRLLPDSLLIGSGLLALLTQSFSMVVFFGVLCESAVLNSILQTMFMYLDKRGVTATAEVNIKQCKSGFYNAAPSAIFSVLKGADIKGAFPSPPIFFLSTAASYLIASLYTLRDELEQLGSDYSARYYIAIFASFLFILTLAFWRLANKCESVGFLTLSLLAGGIVGSLLVLQNLLLFGKDSINMIGIPLLRERSADKKPIYICPQKVSS